MTVTPEEIARLTARLRECRPGAMCAVAKQAADALDILLSSLTTAREEIERLKRDAERDIAAALRRAERAALGSAIEIANRQIENARQLGQHTGPLEILRNRLVTLAAERPRLVQG